MKNALIWWTYCKLDIISIEYFMIFTTESGRLTPYPNMSDEELDSFEHWVEQEF